MFALNCVCVCVGARARACQFLSLSNIFNHGFQNKKDASDNFAKYLKHDLSRFTKASLDEFYDHTLK
jgi:hypothetical protein